MYMSTFETSNGISLVLSYERFWNFTTHVSNYKVFYNIVLFFVRVVWREKTNLRTEKKVAKKLENDWFTH